jgi:hypothetical protein
MAFPFCRLSYHPDPGCCCSAAASRPWVGRLPYCHLSVDAYRPLAFGHRFLRAPLPGANSPLPPPTIFALSRTSNFHSSSCIYQARMGGRRDAPALIEQERCQNGICLNPVIRPQILTEISLLRTLSHHFARYRAAKSRFCRTDILVCHRPQTGRNDRQELSHVLTLATQGDAKCPYVAATIKRTQTYRMFTWGEGGKFD